MAAFTTRIKNWTKHVPWIGAVATGIWILFLRVPFIATPLNFDEHQYLYGAWQVLSGKGFFSTQWDNKPPLIHLMYILTSLVFGGFTLWHIRLFGLLYGMLTVLAFYWLATLLFQSRPWSWASTLLFATLFFNPTIQGQYSNTENFFVLWIILAAGFMLKNINHARWSFLCIGIAALFKPTTLLMVVPLFVYQYCLSPRDQGRIRRSLTVLKSSVFAALPASVWVVYLVHIGKLSAAIEWTIMYNIFVHVALHVPHGNQANALGLLMENFHPIWNITALFWVAAVVGILRTAASPRSSRWFLMGWGIAAAVSTGAGGFYFSHYFLELTAPIVLLMTDGLTCLYDWIKGRTVQSSLGATAVVASLILISMVMAVRPLVKNWQQYLDYRHGIHRETIVSPAEQSYIDAGNYLKTAHHPNDTFFAWDGSPMLYFLSDIHPSTEYIWNYPFLGDTLQFPTQRGWFTDYMQARQKLLAYMDHTPPTYVEITVDPTTISEQYKEFPGFFDRVFRNYRLEQIFGNLWIYQYGKNEGTLQVYIVPNTTDDVVSAFDIKPSGVPDSELSVDGIQKPIDHATIQMDSMVWSYPFQGIERPIVLSARGSQALLSFKPPSGVQAEYYNITLHFMDGTEYTIARHQFEYAPALHGAIPSPRIVIRSDIHADLVGLGDIKPSGTNDIVVEIKDLTLPIKEVFLTVADHTWHAPFNGIESPILLQQSYRSSLLYFEPRGFTGNERVNLRIILVDGSSRQFQFQISPTPVQ